MVDISEHALLQTCMPGNGRVTAGWLRTISACGWSLWRGRRCPTKRLCWPKDFLHPVRWAAQGWVGVARVHAAMPPTHDAATSVGAARRPRPRGRRKADLVRKEAERVGVAGGVRGGGPWGGLAPCMSWAGEARGSGWGGGSLFGGGWRSVVRAAWGRSGSAPACERRARADVTQP